MSILQSDGLDERQRDIENRVVKNSLLFTLALVLINGFVARHHQWANPLVQSLTLISVATMWASMQLLWRGAYFTAQSRKNPSAKFGTAIFSTLWFWYLAAAGVTHPSHIWADGKAGPEFLSVFLAVTFTVMTISEIIRFFHERRLENAPDED